GHRTPPARTDPVGDRARLRARSTGPCRADPRGDPRRATEPPGSRTAIPAPTYGVSTAGPHRWPSCTYRARSTPVDDTRHAASAGGSAWCFRPAWRVAALRGPARRALLEVDRKLSAACADMRPQCLAREVSRAGDGTAT